MRKKKLTDEDRFELSLAGLLGMTRGELLDRVSAPELIAWGELWHRSPWGPEADDWRTGFIMSASNGQPPDTNRPKWGGEKSKPRVIELSFEQACKALAR